MELETAVREKCSFVHLVWRDGSYDMVKIQQKLKYGRSFGVEFGEVDIVKLQKPSVQRDCKSTRPMKLPQSFQMPSA